jgi:hypothetical protein
MIMYVKVTGYVEVEGEHIDPHHSTGLTSDGREEVRAVRVGDLEDLEIARDDRP